MVPATQAVYLRFEDIQPPIRFVTILEAYIEFLKDSDATWSARRLMQMTEPKLSPSYLYNIRQRITRNDGKPTPVTISRIVGALNSVLPSNQQWPIRHAFIAADQEDKFEENIRPPLPSPRRAALLNRPDDHLPHTIAKVNTPLIRFEDIQAKGLGEAVTMQRVVQLANNMAFIEGRIPGYTEQQAGEWVLIQDVGARNTESQWVLVRDDEEIKAMMRQEVKPSQRIIAWILGIMRISA